VAATSLPRDAFIPSPDVVSELEDGFPSVCPSSGAARELLEASEVIPSAAGAAAAAGGNLIDDPELGVEYPDEKGEASPTTLLAVS